MFKKDSVEDRLNQDDDFRARFLKSPAKVLEAEGLSLSEENAARLQQQLDALAGTELPSGASVAANGVMISISKSF